MNVTIKISDELCREARHLAIDRRLSLSGWVAQLIEEAVEEKQETETRGLLQALSMTDDGGDFELPRNNTPPSGVSFE